MSCSSCTGSASISRLVRVVLVLVRPTSTGGRSAVTTTSSVARADSSSTASSSVVLSAETITFFVTRVL